MAVTTIRGTKDIVEMVSKFSKNRIDVNLLEHKKVKHLSQIEKFNQKYRK